MTLLCLPQITMNDGGVTAVPQPTSTITINNDQGNINNTSSNNNNVTAVEDEEEFDDVLTREEEALMKDDDHELILTGDHQQQQEHQQQQQKWEQNMLTVAFVKSVVEKHTTNIESNEDTKPNDTNENSQTAPARYGLRKRSNQHSYKTPLRPQLYDSILPEPVANPLAGIQDSSDEEETAISMASAAPPPPRRERIFSVDMDPNGLVFDSATLESLTQRPVQTTSLAVEPPKKPTVSQVPSPTEVPSSSVAIVDDILSIDPTKSTGLTPLMTSIKEGRDRAFSFEFFSLNADEPLPPISSSMMMKQPQRPRGDSIIFDPASFRDGGIHEENALIKSSQKRREDAAAAAASSETDALLNSTSDFMTTTTTTTTSSQSTRLETTSSKIRGNNNNTHSLILPAQTPRSMVASTTSSSSLPQPSQTIPSSLVGTALAHSPCPMDLLNKDGRIGIYLPDARRERIKKFHSKRNSRIWKKRIKYDCRKKLADSRPRVKGRFVKRTDNMEEED